MMPKVDINNENSVLESTLNSYEKDDYSGQQSWMGPFIHTDIWQQRGSENFDRDLDVTLSAYRNTGQQTQYYLFVNIRYRGEWRHYDTAYDKDRFKFPIQMGSKDVIDCSGYSKHCVKSENIGVIMTRSYLKSHANTGIDLAVYGSGVQHTVIVPAAYVKGFLAAVPDGISVESRKRPSIEKSFSGKKRKK